MLDWISTESWHITSCNIWFVWKRGNPPKLVVYHHFLKINIQETSHTLGVYPIFDTPRVLCFDQRPSTVSTGISIPMEHGDSTNTSKDNPSVPHGHGVPTGSGRTGSQRPRIAGRRKARRSSCRSKRSEQRPRRNKMPGDPAPTLGIWILDSNRY